jgi:hypothetical protein
MVLSSSLNNSFSTNTFDAHAFSGSSSLTAKINIAPGVTSEDPRIIQASISKHLTTIELFCDQPFHRTKIADAANKLDIDPSLTSFDKLLLLRHNTAKLANQLSECGDVNRVMAGLALLSEISSILKSNDKVNPSSNPEIANLFNRYSLVISPSQIAFKLPEGVNFHRACLEVIESCRQDNMSFPRIVSNKALIEMFFQATGHGLNYTVFKDNLLMKGTSALAHNVDVLKRGGADGLSDLGPALLASLLCYRLTGRPFFDSEYALVKEESGSDSPESVTAIQFGRAEKDGKARFAIQRDARAELFGCPIGIKVEPSKLAN